MSLSNKLKMYASSAKNRAFPILTHSPNYTRDTQMLLEETSVTSSEAQVRSALETSYQTHKGKLLAAKTVDSLDMISSSLGILVEGITALVSGPGSYVPNIVEETIEMVPKAALLAYIARNNPGYTTEIIQTAMIELASFGIPVGGDLIDIGTTPYISLVEKIIRDDAKQNLIQEAILAAIPPPPTGPAVIPPKALPYEP